MGHGLLIIIIDLIGVLSHYHDVDRLFSLVFSCCLLWNENVSKVGNSTTSSLIALFVQQYLDVVV